MRCITYGWVVLFIIMIQIVLIGLAFTIGGSGAVALMAIGSILGLGIHIYWLSGFFSDCPDGYLGNVIKKPKA